MNHKRLRLVQKRTVTHFVYEIDLENEPYGPFYTKRLRYRQKFGSTHFSGAIHIKCSVKSKCRMQIQTQMFGVKGCSRG